MTVRELIRKQADTQRITVFNTRNAQLITEGSAEEILMNDEDSTLYDYEVSALDSEVKITSNNDEDLYIYF